jgi:apolipoprotein N-acyltransferase
MDRLANAVILSWGWRRRGLAFAAGALSSLAQPPFFVFPLLWLTFPVLVWLVDGAAGQGRSGRVRRIFPAFAVGWWFGFGYFLAGLWWIGAAFLVDAREFGWLMPFAVLGLTAGLAVFFGLGTAAARIFWSEDWRRIFSLALGLGGAEWLRGHILTGFPWNALGYALTAGEALMQSAALFGLDALNVVAVLIFAAPAVLAPQAGRPGRSWALPSLAVLSIAGLGLYGVARLAKGQTDFVPDVSLRIVQPALDQALKWDPAREQQVLDAYLSLSAPAGGLLAPGSILVWPESAFPFALTQRPNALAAIANLLPPGTALVTGAFRIEATSTGEQRVYNTLYTVGDDGTILDAYDKVHLVPFGEYLPAHDLLQRIGLRQLAADGFAAGPRRRDLVLPFGPPFAPLICYEAIFPGAVLADGPRPGYLLNVTNDGWFGLTTGPYQHFHQARMRSVEEGLPLVRAANTGISAVIDPYGRVLASTKLGQAVALDARLPKAIPETFYAKWRTLIFYLLMIVCALLALSSAIYPRHRR